MDWRGRGSSGRPGWGDAEWGAPPPLSLSFCPTNSHLYPSAPIPPSSFPKHIFSYECGGGGRGGGETKMRQRGAREREQQQQQRQRKKKARQNGNSKITLTLFVMSFLYSTEREILVLRVQFLTSHLLSAIHFAFLSCTTSRNSVRTNSEERRRRRRRLDKVRVREWERDLWYR